jgi:uncharacterized protein DUF4177
VTSWEYKIVELLSSEETQAVEATLNVLSAQGWEVQQVFGVAGNGGTTCFLLRRSATQPPTGGESRPDPSAMSWPSR